jgi:DnaK suppressor protein
VPTENDAAADLAAIDADLAAVDAVLHRLDDGTYGVCARCGGPIPDAALEADPFASVCPAPCAG